MTLIGDIHTSSSRLSEALKTYTTGLSILDAQHGRETDSSDSESTRWWGRWRHSHETAGKHKHLPQKAADELTIEYYERRAELLDKMAYVCRKMNDWQSALKHHIASAELIEQFAKDTDKGKAFMNIGLDYRNLDEYEKALEYYNKGLIQFKFAKEYTGQAIVYSNIAHLYEHQHKWQQAKSYYKQSLKLAKRAQFKSGVAHANKKLEEIKNRE